MGYDLYSLDNELLYDFLIISKKVNLRLYRLIQKDGSIYFYIPIYQRYLVNKIDLPINRIKSIGFISYLLLFFCKTSNVVFIFSFFISFFFFTSLILDVRIIGNNQQINDRLLDDLKQYNINLFLSKKSFEELNDILIDIKQNYKNDIEYLNLYQQGAVFFVEYISQKKEYINHDVYTNLYAASDGLITLVDVDSGVIKVKVNDYVKKGDLLVENYILSTQNQMSLIPVKAKIYAYTFHQFSASKKSNSKDNAQIFYELLLSIRTKINVGSKIDVEKVLQIERSHSTITLKMHYTLIEDIAIEGESREEDH